MAKIFLWLLTAAPCATAAPTWDVWPQKVPQGQSLLVRVPAGTTVMSVEGAPAGQKPTLWPCGPARDRQCFLVAVPLDAKPRAAHFKAIFAGGEKRLDFRVTKGKFKVNKLTVDPKITRPTPEDQARAVEERKEIEAAYATGAPSALWKGPFQMPTPGGVTSLFGNQRTYNGQVQSTHFGVDLRAGETTPLYAAGPGKVLLAKSFFYAGNMVLIDHGAGVFTSYAHLSKLEVTAGQEVAAGTKLGMAGATGRVTGPHLHWAARLNAVPTDAVHLEKVLARAFEVPAVSRKPKKKSKK